MSSYLLKCFITIIIAYMCNSHKSLSVLLIHLIIIFRVLFISHFILNRFKSYHRFTVASKQSLFYEIIEKKPFIHSQIVICSLVVTKTKKKSLSIIDNKKYLNFVGGGAKKALNSLS